MKTKQVNFLPLIQRPRRNRKSSSIRAMLKENHLLASDFVMPFFLIEDAKKCEKIEKFPGIYRLSADLILKKASLLHKKGIQAIALFPVVEKNKKSLNGSEALNPIGHYCKAIKLIKAEIPSLCVITDLALDPYTSHGHDGILNNKREVDNDATVSVLCQMALIHAEAGADIVAPSDMMDGRVKAIRNTLDANSFFNTSIMSYTAKYASSLYNPFRDAVSSTLKFGDKKSYQMDPANTKEAIIEARADDKEGADILMVKPASIYLDIISKIKNETNKPIAAYHVSGEYCMVKAAHKLGYLNEIDVFNETLLSIKRAGANIIISYATEEILEVL